MATLHIHFDESGNWHFNPHATKYLVLAAAWTYDPPPLAAALTSLRFELNKEGIDLDAFHASPDLQPTRDRVVRTLLATENWHFGAVLVEKRKVNPAIRDPQKFYPKFAGILLKFILRQQPRGKVSKAVVYTDTLPMNTRAKREGVIKAVKTECAAELPGTCQSLVFSHNLSSNCWIQVADYCCWAVYRKWENGDPRTFDQLRPRLAGSDLNVTAGGDGTNYY